MVAELILIVNLLYRIMSVAMLNCEWYLALRSVLGTPGVWPKEAKIITPSPSVHCCKDDKVKKLCKRWGICCPLQLGDFLEILEVLSCM